MSTDQGSSLLHALKTWEDRYQAERDHLTVQEIHELRGFLTQLTEQIERDATGPSTLPQPLLDDRP
jgi:hypothetical protein